MLARSAPIIDKNQIPVLVRQAAARQDQLAEMSRRRIAKYRQQREHWPDRQLMEPRRLHPQGTNQHVGILAIGIEDPRIRSQILRFFHSIAEQGVVIADPVIQAYHDMLLCTAHCFQGPVTPRALSQSCRPATRICPRAFFRRLLAAFFTFRRRQTAGSQCGLPPGCSTPGRRSAAWRISTWIWSRASSPHDAAQGQVEVGRDIHAQRSGMDKLYHMLIENANDGAADWGRHPPEDSGELLEHALHESPSKVGDGN